MTSPPQPPSPPRHMLHRLLAAIRSSRCAKRGFDALFQRWYELPCPPTHFYSPLPDVRELRADVSRWYRENDAPGIDWNMPAQLKFLGELQAFSEEAAALPALKEVTSEGFGLGYGEVEAPFLYMVLRRLQPRQMVEVGSGVSTVYALRALEKNQADTGTACQLTCVEPYPQPALRQWVANQRVSLLEQEVQTVEMRIFESLQAGDVLFIDSSHVSKLGSDVDFLVLHVLPRLAPGVMVHVHDMALPMPSIPPSHPVFTQSLFWNEGALLRAFLCFNSAYRIRLCHSLLHVKCPDAISRLVPFYDPQTHFPSSLWMERI